MKYILEDSNNNLLLISNIDEMYRKVVNAFRINFISHGLWLNN
mgnify:CR=1 FL=1